MYEFANDFMYIHMLSVQACCNSVVFETVVFVVLLLFVFVIKVFQVTLILSCLVELLLCL